jgi:2,4-dichlorophenol 6-monooxygenase
MLSLKMTLKALSEWYTLEHRLRYRHHQDCAMTDFTTDVLVVGAGPAGLTATALLARQGTSAVTVTKYRSTANGPRAHITNQRTMEIMRDLGLEEDVYHVGDKTTEVPDLVWMTSLADREIARRQSWGTRSDRKGDYEASSPCHMANIAQHLFEPIILRAAMNRGSDIRFSTELVKLKQDADGVTATVVFRPTGATYDIRARYVIGADGGRSTVADQLGIEYDGRRGLGHAINVHIEADLGHLLGHRPGVLYWTNHPGREYFFGSGAFATVRKWNEWMVQFSYDPETDQLADTPEALVPRIQAAIGDPSVEVKILGLGKWELNSLVARQYRKGRVFIAGDAAHRHTPANGLGSNTSIQDTYNLAWKISMVVKGHAEDGLLDSYETERLPVGCQVVGRATKSIGLVKDVPSTLGIRSGQSEADGWAAIDEFFAPTPEGRKRRADLRDILDRYDYGINCHDVEMGQRFETGALVSDGSPFPKYTLDPELYYHATTHPGACLPHVWLCNQHGLRVSSLDLVPADTWALLTGVEGSSWIIAAKELSAELGFPIASVAIGLGGVGGVTDAYGQWARISEISDAGVVLVRPDRFVAWRSAQSSKTPLEELRRVFKAILRPQT